MSAVDQHRLAASAGYGGKGHRELVVAKHGTVNDRVEFVSAQGKRATISGPKPTLRHPGRKVRYPGAVSREACPGRRLGRRL